MTTRSSPPNRARGWANLRTPEVKGSGRFYPAQFERRVNHG